MPEEDVLTPTLAYALERLEEDTYVGDDSGADYDDATKRAMENKLSDLRLLVLALYNKGPTA